MARGVSKSVDFAFSNPPQPLLNLPRFGGQRVCESGQVTCVHKTRQSRRSDRPVRCYRCSAAAKRSVAFRPNNKIASRTRVVFKDHSKPSANPLNTLAKASPDPRKSRAELPEFSIIYPLARVFGRHKCRPYIFQEDWGRDLGAIIGVGGHQAKSKFVPPYWTPYQASAVAMTVSSWAPGGAP